MPRDESRVDSDPTAGNPHEPRSSRAPESRRALRKRILRSGGGPLLATTAAVIALLTLFQAAFLTSDDAALTAIVNGDFTGKRSSALVVAPAILGHILRLGYALLPQLPWYGINLYALQIVAWSGIGAMAFTLRRRPPVAERIVIGAIICAVLPWMILRLSFTSTSILIGVLGVLAFAAGAKAPGRVGLTYTIAGGALLGVVDFVRFSSFLGVVILFAPVLGIIAFKAGFRRCMAFALTVGAFVLVGYGTTRLEYSRTPEWRAFMTMNKARGALSQTPRLRNENVSNSDLAKIGWSRNDLLLFSDDVYPDPNVYTDQDIRELAVESPLVRGTTSIKYVYDTLRSSSDDHNGPVVSVLVALAIAIALRRSRAVAAVILLSAVWAVAVLTVLLLYERLPGRVGVPFEAGAALLALIVPAYLAPSGEQRARTNRRPLFSSPAATALIALVALFAAGPVWHAVHSPSQLSTLNKRGAAAGRTLLARLEFSFPKGIFIGRGDYFGSWIDPLSNKTQYTDPRVIPLGWATNSPLFTARLARAGVTDLYTALKTDPHVHMLGAAFEVGAVQIYYRQHRYATVRFVVSAQHLPVQFNSVVRNLNLWSVASPRLSAQHPPSVTIAAR